MSDQTLRQLASSVRLGERTFVDINQTALENRRTDLGAYCHVDDELVIDRAHAADAALNAGHDHGLFMGMPVSVKDLYGAPGFPVHAGSPNALPAKFSRPGPVVAALLDQHAVITGKTHTVEFAFGGIGTNPHLPTPKNPWDAAQHRVPGGSSSGAGVSLCEGSALVALGTDTAGSVRIPAAWCGKVGLKTTAKRWSLDGIVPLSSTLDTPGVLANCVDDVIETFYAIDPATNNDRPATAAGALAGYKFGRCDALFWDDLSPGVGESVEAALRELATAGAGLDAVDLPEVGPAYDLFKMGGPVSIELHRFLHSELPEWLDTLDPNVGARVGDAANLTHAEYERRLERMATWSASVADKLATVDVLVAPTVANTPPRIEEVSTADGYGPRNLLALRNTSIVNYLGLCAITIPVGLDAAGMPVGLMLMAKGGHDEQLLAIARDAERVLGTGLQRLGTPPRLAVP